MYAMEIQAYREDVGRRLQQARKSRGVSQAVLARWMELSVSAISSYEKGRRPVNAEDLYKMSTFLNVPLRFLIGAETTEEWIDEEAARHFRGVPPPRRPLAIDILKQLAREDDSQDTTHGRKAE
jgi:transcriptional regulator with XRE-family HTH domain